MSPAGGRWRTLAGDLGIAFSSQVFYKLAGYVTLALLTRYLDKAAMGEFFFTATLAGTAVLFTELGTHRTLVRSAASDPERALSVTSDILSFRLPLFALYFALVNAFTLLVRPELLAVMLLTSLYVALEELYLSFGSLFVGIQRLGHNAIAGVCCKLVLIGLILFVMRANLGFRAILVAHVIANAVLVLVAYIIVRRRLGRVRLSWRSGRARHLTAESFPLFAVAMLSLLHAKADTVMLGFMGSYSDVASYQAAYKLLEASRFAVRPVIMVLFPLLAAMAARREWDRLRTYMGRALTSAGWVGAAVAGVLALGAGIIVRLAFGGQYADAGPLLRILVLSVPLLYVSNVAIMVSQAICREREVTTILAICVVVNVGANLIAIPRWGPLGAAWTTVGSELLLAGMLLRSNAVWLAQPLATKESVA